MLRGAIANGALKRFIAVMTWIVDIMNKRRALVSTSSMPSMALGAICIEYDFTGAGFL